MDHVTSIGNFEKKCELYRTGEQYYYATNNKIKIVSHTAIVDSIY